MTASTRRKSSAAMPQACAPEGDAPADGMRLNGEQTCPAKPAAWMSAVVVQVELERMRTEPDRVDFVAVLPLNEGADESFTEDVSLEQEVAVVLERLERFGERLGSNVRLRQLFRGHIVNVAIERLARVDLVLNA